MKNYRLFIVLLGLSAVFSGIVSCTKDFGDTNTNPSVVITPDIKFLLTYAEDKIVTYQGGEWIWENLEQLFRFTQHLTTDPYELTANVNSRYLNYYKEILPNLVEIRRQIGLKTDSANYQKMAAVTYVLQALHGIKVTDMNGSIPYMQAIKGRYESNFSPEYNTQESLFNTWLQELDNAIAVLSNEGLENQNSYANADVYFKSDWKKWVKLANTLKLRIAARLENEDNTKTSAIFQQVLQDPTGPITEDGDQLSYQNIDYRPLGIGGEIDYRSPRFATTSIMNFLKKTRDPRLPVYFDPNGLQGSFRDTLAKYNTSLPSFINPNDPLIQFQGGPADFTTNPAVATYIKNPFPVGRNGAGSTITQYFLMSPINRLFFSPGLNNANGNFKDVVVTAAESCLLMAEFIQKGYAGSAPTKGTAEDWYKKGVSSSIRTMNEIAKAANSTTAFSGSGETEINAFLERDDIMLNGTNDLERIYIQEHLNFIRNANEAFVFCRRTGYPKKNSAYYPREAFNEPIPRRFWTVDPGEVNRANWQAAMSDQGFTPNAQDVPTLSSQRVWYDKKAPDFGEGN